jgi:aminopeptidase YwaD
MARRRTLTLAATALLSVAVLVVGTRPRAPRAFERVPDWATHAATYAVLAFLAERSAGLLGARPAALWGVAYAVAHGGLLEILQSSIPTRAAEWRDVLSDTVGAALGAAVALARRPR